MPKKTFPQKNCINTRKRPSTAKRLTPLNSLKAPSMKNSETRLVYSTLNGRLCPDCQKSVNHCCCKQKKTLNHSAQNRPDGPIRVHLETKGRNGKGVTVVRGIPLSEEALQALGKSLKQKCGSGGTVKEGQIEVQGDQRELIMGELTKLGFKVKRAGG